MPYVVVDNFSGGLDDRKDRLTAAAGTLTRLTNAHLTAGGEIEKRKRFYPLYTFPDPGYCIGGKLGLRERVWLFGNGPAPAGLPWIFDWVDVTSSPARGRAVRLVSVDHWGATPYALVEYTNGERILWFGTAPIVLTSGPNWGYDGNALSAQDMLIMGQKAYLVQDSILYASGVAEPTKFGLEELTGTALFDVSHYGPRAFNLTALSAYQNRMVTFSDHAAVVWDLDPDPDLTAPVQFIDNFGCRANRSVVSYGEADTFVLSSTGVRSVRARDSSNIATINDIGSPINRTLTRAMEAAYIEVPNAIGVYEPTDGRYWLSLFDTLYVLSYFPSSRVTAWSTYALQGRTVVDMFQHDSTVLMLMSDGILYSYGALRIRGKRPTGPYTKVPYPANEYDDTVVEVELPFIDAERPATRKNWGSLDVALEGLWDVYAGFDINSPAEDLLARLKRSTYDEPGLAVDGSSPQLRLRLQSRGDQYARLSNLALHYQEETSD